VTGVPFSGVAVSVSSQTLAEEPHRANDADECLPRQPGTFRKESDVACDRAAGDFGTADSFVFINDPVAGPIHPARRHKGQPSKWENRSPNEGAMKDALQGQNGVPAPAGDSDGT